MTDNIPDLPGYVRQAFYHLFAPNRLSLLGYSLLVLLPLVLLLTACGEKTEKQVLVPRPVRTITAPAASWHGEFMQTGEIHPHDELPLGFRQDGRLLARLVDVGDRVKAGQLLATQESSVQQNQLSSARSSLESSLAAEHLAALNLQRMKQLMPSGAIARVQFDTAQSEWLSAVSRRKSSEAELKTAQEYLDWAQLKAPAAGIITQINAQPGQVLSAGQTVLTLAAGDTLDAIINVASPQRFEQHHGDFNVSLVSDPSVHARGILRDISPQADPQTRTWRVRIQLINPPQGMALGASVQVRLPDSGPALISLPASSLARINGEPAVFVVDQATHQLVLRPIKLGGYTANTILVSGGITPGDAVVTAGVSKLRQGEKVAPGEGIQ
jgi:RND family efflux transporter MFP subunit